MLKYRHPTMGRFELLTFRKSSSVGGTFVSEKTLAGLVGYFNKAKTPSPKRILTILEDMLELGKIEPPVFSERIEGPMMVMKAGRALPNPEFKKIAPEKYHLQLEIEDRSALLNRKLAGYRFWPWIYTTGQDQWVVTWQTEREQKENLEQMSEGEALELILNLARSGYLGRLRRCAQCHNWLYAKFRHQNFCSMKCQQKSYTHSERWKKHRREYMREYYRRNYLAPRSKIKGKSKR